MLIASSRLSERGVRRHASKPSTIATLPRKLQNHAKPLASAIAVGSVRSPRDVNPVIATARQTAAKIAEAIIVVRSENFMIVANEGHASLRDHFCACWRTLIIVGLA